MLKFHSMFEVVLYMVVTIIALLWAGTRRNPLRAAGAFVHEIFASRKYLFHFAAVAAILFFNKIELVLEQHMKIQADFTSAVYRLEGSVSAMLQHNLEHGILTWASAFFYVVVFPVLMIVSLGIYTAQKNYRLFYAVCYAMMINYMAAIPFYLFFPVKEVWAYEPNVRLLITQVFPTFENDYRPLSGLDNCFPSLHTSLSVSMALIALRSGNRFWMRFTTLSAVFIIFSVLYLGVHWLSDTFTGLLLALFASRLALRISEVREEADGYSLLHLKERNVGD
jgi:membrane-associated phospholipid phosphatase